MYPFRMFCSKGGLGMKSTKKVMYSLALLCQVTAIVLEALPYSAVLIFAPGPNERITKTFSYFSLDPFGYANFFPLPTALLTVAVTALCLICLITKTGMLKLHKVAFICSMIAVVFSILPLLLLGGAYMSSAGYAISALLLVSVVFQALANRRQNI